MPFSVDSVISRGCQPFSQFFPFRFAEITLLQPVGGSAASGSRAGSRRGVRTVASADCVRPTRFFAVSGPIFTCADHSAKSWLHGGFEFGASEHLSETGTAKCKLTDGRLKGLVCYGRF